MNKNLRTLTGSVIVMMAISLIGCGEGYKSSSGSDSGNYSMGSVEPLDTTDIEKVSAEADAAMIDASKTLATVVDDNGKVKLFGKSSTSEVQTQFLSGIKAKLTQKLDLVVSKIASVKDKFNLARAKVAEAIAKLNPADPAQAALIAKLQEQMGKIDQLENAFFDGVHKLAAKLSFATAALDKALIFASTAAGSINPILGIIVGAAGKLLMSDLKEIITGFQNKLMAL